MKKQNLLLVLATVFVVSACQNKGVPVVKATQDSTAISYQQKIQPTLPDNLPANATAICRDGAYSTATDGSTCVGNGGVLNVINRYHAD